MTKWLIENKERTDIYMKKRKYRIIIIPITIISLFLGGFYYFIQPKHQVVLEMNDTSQSHEPQSEEKQVIQDQRRQISLISVGNSDLYSGLNPMQLWHDYGITAFNISAAKQNMKLSYYMFKNALMVQKPKCLLLEVDQFFEDREEIEPEGYEYTALAYCYPLFKNSDKWDKIKNKKFVKKEESTHRLNYLGFYDSREVKKYKGGFHYMKKTQKREKLPRLTQKYLPQILSLAKENNCEVLFVEFPSQTSWNYQRYNTVYDIAKQHHIPYIDFNVNQYDTGFDWKTDSRDGGNHLNYYGATKMTKFIGEYLKEHYTIEDDRKHIEYQDYQKIYEKYQQNFMS